LPPEAAKPHHTDHTHAMCRLSCVGVGKVMLMAAAVWPAVARDMTLEPGASGARVVEACIARLAQAGIFPPDYGFLRRIAYVESKDGTDPRTYSRPAYHGGIWQIDPPPKGYFGASRDVSSHPDLVSKHQQILDYFGIDWMQLTYEDMRKPLYSMLAARLGLSNIPEPIPSTVDGQARYWKIHYNSEDDNAAGSEDKFLEDVRALESSGSKDCVAPLRTMVVLDGSGSIGASNYEAAKTFAANLVPALVIAEHGSKIGMLYYSTLTYELFNFATDVAYAQRLIRQARYPGGGTMTGRAIDVSNSYFARDTEWINLCVVLTDGDSRDSVRAPAQRAEDLGVTVLAIGIGDAVHTSTLLDIANGHPEHVLNVGGYSAIDNVRWSLTRTACSAPRQVEAPTSAMSRTIEQSLGRDQMSFVAVPVPEEGVTIDLTASQGAVVAYASYEMKTPSEAYHDYRIPAGSKTFVPSAPTPSPTPSSRRLAENAANTTTLYVGLEGLQENNMYKVVLTAGGFVNKETANKGCLSRPSLLPACLLPAFARWGR